MQRLFILPLAACVSGSLAAQSYSQTNAVQVEAVVQASPASITLSWPSFPNTNGITIYRKLKSATSWGGIYAAPGASATQYTDNGVSVGTYYEYKLVRSASSGTGYGYVATGIEVQPTEYMGKVVLLVDNTFTTSLATQLTQLEQDLRSDGWAVLRHDVSRSAAVTSIRALVQADYNADPTNVKAVYMIGHVPVPYSGNINPDGHSGHLGAWPCDGYYGEMNGTWTDNSVNNNGAQEVS
ncbi:MAG: hypothetical protein H6597_07240, partial [Flavobacteriales bacterium]|nr:hypothetical protein [Flavobacteriales bacterium]